MYLKNSKKIVIKIGSSLLVDQEKKIRKKWLSSFAKDIKKLRSNNQKVIEYSPIAIKYLKNISKKINNNRGALLIIDYGYLEDAMKDTLMAIKKHKFIDIFKEIGSSDITYNLNFKLLKKITNILKLKCQGITTQRNFLTNLGIHQRAEIISRNLPFSKKADIYYRLKRLVDKNQMGDLFKVMLITNKKINFKLGF